MFRTFRQRLLFWFLVFISSNVIIIGLASQYLLSRERISQASENVEKAYILLLKLANEEQGFFSYDTKNSDFFKYKHSQRLNNFDSLQSQLSEAITKITGISIEKEAIVILRDLAVIDSLFKEEVRLILERGYKDYQLEGSMRQHAHWLENKSQLRPEMILSLRRLEKDYIIRNELIYVDKLNNLCNALSKSVNESAMSKKDSILFHLENYRQNFNQLVLLDKTIGIKDNSGLKLMLDRKTKELENYFEHLMNKTREQQSALFLQLTLSYGFLALVLFALSLLISLLIARKVTKPLTELTQYITRFVDSNFTIEEVTPPIRSKDEIGKLTQNFAMLKDEVILRLRFFKIKVDERTAELAEANKRLLRINEANSRFVPKEFLHFLNKPSIEEIKLGDQSEREMTIMFTDIRSFTKISEALTPQQNFDFLNDYFKVIVPVIKRHGGFIDKFIGDSILALFPDTPENAIRAALEIVTLIRQFNLERTGEPVLAGTGIHTGKLMLGTVGYDHRLETTVISDAVNIAARVEGLTRYYNCSTVITRACLDRIQDYSEFSLRFLDSVKMKGKSQHVEVFELLHEEDSKKLSYQNKFEQGVRLLKERKPEKAIFIFRELMELNPNDGAVHRFMARCEDYMKNGLPLDWDGTLIMQVK